MDDEKLKKEYTDYLILKGCQGKDTTRMKVRIRDNFTCQDCGDVRTPFDVWKANIGKEELKGRTKNFDVHHIGELCGKHSQSYDHEDMIPKMVTLCHSCHYNRPEHGQKCKVKTDVFVSLKTSLRNKPRQENLEQYIELKKKGLTHNQIGKRFGVSALSVSKTLLRNGVKGKSYYLTINGARV